MPPAYEILLLNTAVPQIQAAQAGDTYVVPRDIAVNANMTVTGNVGIGTSSPGAKLDVADATQATGAIMRLTNSASSSAWVAGDVIGQIDFYSTDASLAGTKAQIKSFADTGTASTGINYSALSFSTMLNGTFAERMRLDSAGNLGLGVTPSAWGSGFVALDIDAVTSLACENDVTTVLGQGCYNNSGWKYRTTSIFGVSRYDQYNGSHIWQTAPAGTAGNPISFTQRMTLTEAGNLLVGDTSSRLSGIAASGQSIQLGARTFIGTNPDGDTALGGLSGSGFTALFAAGSERARITSGGDFLVGTTTNTSYGGSVFSKNGSNANVLAILNTATSLPYGPQIEFTAAAPNDATRYFVQCRDTGGERASIRSNGGLANYQSNNVDLSDIRTKTDINPLASYWNKIAALEIVTYKYKDQTHDDLNIGVIAQQVEQVAPEFVDSDGFGETPEDGVPLKTIYNKDLTFAAIKALQEAMARIETLEAKVAQLEGN